MLIYLFIHIDGILDSLDFGVVSAFGLLGNCYVSYTCKVCFRFGMNGSKLNSFLSYTCQVLFSVGINFGLLLSFGFQWNLISDLVVWLTHIESTSFW